MSYSNDNIEKLQSNLKLLANIINQDKAKMSLKVDLAKVEDIINNKIPETVKDNAPDDFFDIYSDFKSEYEKFREFLLYEKLIGKNIIALGGGFSSGKSSFLNILLRGEGKNSVLPESPNPTTAVPTYIVAGKEHHVSGINVFDARVDMEVLDIRKVSHGFEKTYSDGLVSEKITLGHILESIFFETPWQQYENVAFLDTPGYSKPDSETYSLKTDEQIARRQLNLSNYILWFVDANDGTIKEADVKFIKTINPDIPKLIIVSKSDTKPIDELELIIEKIKSTLDLKGISYVDVLSFSNNNNSITESKLKDFITQDIDKLSAIFDLWNNQKYESNFARNFKVLFVKCKDYYKESIEAEERKLSWLNNSTTKLSDVAEDILEPLEAMKKETQKKLRILKDKQKVLKELQNEFFTEIKLVAEHVGISMPEPSEIDLLQDKIQNPLELIEKYKQEKGITTDSSIVDMLQEIFENVNPVINKIAGGSEYRSELVEILKGFSVKTEDVHINDTLKKTDEYKRIIADI